MRIKTTAANLLNALEKIVLETPDGELIAAARKNEFEEVRGVFALAIERSLMHEEGVSRREARPSPPVSRAQGAGRGRLVAMFSGKKKAPEIEIRKAVRDSLRSKARKKSDKQK
jgi:hypothetical protein